MSRNLGTVKSLFTGLYGGKEKGPVNRGKRLIEVQFTSDLHFKFLMGREFKPGKLRDTVNRSTLNQGFMLVGARADLWSAIISSLNQAL